jgi:hypothetical protein
MNKDKLHIDDKSLKDDKGGFQLPQDYLQNFESKMLSKIEEEIIKEKTYAIQLKPILMALIPTAAILVLAYFLFIENSNQTENDIINSELSWDEYASFDESWILIELEEFEDESDADLDAEIDFLIAEGVTTSEIIEIYSEQP